MHCIINYFTNFTDKNLQKLKLRQLLTQINNDLSDSVQSKRQENIAIIRRVHLHPLDYEIGREGGRFLGKKKLCNTEYNFQVNRNSININ